MEDLRCMFLGGECRSLMNKKISHSDVCIAKISAECVFSIKIIEDFTARMFSEISSALMSRAVKFRISAFYVLQQTPEKWWKNLFFIFFSCIYNLAFIETMLSMLEVDDS